MKLCCRCGFQPHSKRQDAASTGFTLTCRWASFARRTILAPLAALALLTPTTAPAQPANPASATAPDPQALYQQGLNALAAGQPEQARHLLERVVEAQPNFAGAWLDLALATHSSGDPAAAVEHLEYLRRQFSLHPALATQVNHWLTQWQAAPQFTPEPLPLAAPSGWQGAATLAAGYDSNANTGPASQHITLTDSATLELDPAYRPRADTYGQASLSLIAPTLPLGPGRLTPMLLLRGKTFAHEHAYNTLDLQPGLRWAQPAGQGGIWQAHLLAQHYRNAGQSLFNGLRLHLQHTQAWPGPCVSSTSASLENRWHQRLHSLGGILYGAGLGLGCPLPGGGYLSASLRAGQEQARAGRAGGNNHSADFGLNLEQPIGPRQTLQLGWLYNRSADHAGYSPLLQNNAARRLQQHSASIALLHPLNPQWQARLGLEHFSQTSNLSLFQYTGTQIAVGMSYSFD